MLGVELVSPSEMAKIFDDSGLLDRMGPKNLSARGARTREEYRGMYRDGIREWSSVPWGVRERTVRAAVAAKRGCRATGLDSLGGMRWRIAVSSKGVEGGWPHTLGDVMVIPYDDLARRSDVELSRLLVHEAVHVAQRMDPAGASRLVAGEWGFVPASSRDVAAVASLGEARVNPDTDGVVYQLEGRICHPVLADSPDTLADMRLMPAPNHPPYVGLAHNHEHPYEIMAEAIAAAVFPVGSTP